MYLYGENFDFAVTTSVFLDSDTVLTDHLDPEVDIHFQCGLV